MKVEGSSGAAVYINYTHTHMHTRIRIPYFCSNDTLVIELNKKCVNVDIVFDFYNSHNIL